MKSITTCNNSASNFTCNKGFKTIILKAMIYKVGDTGCESVPNYNIENCTVMDYYLNCTLKNGICRIGAPYCDTNLTWNFEKTTNSLYFNFICIPSKYFK